MTIAREAVHRFTREEYYQMVEAGIFQDKRVERLGGEILDMAPQNHPHAWTVAVLNQFLTRHLPEGFFVRCQSPLEIRDEHDPEPDLAVIAGNIRELRSHPQSAALVIEVADDSLRRDRRKAAIYAMAQIPEYWIVDVRGRQIVQYTQPRVVQGRGAEGPEERFEYAVIRALNEPEVIVSETLALPANRVGDLRPPS
ncbi:MAG TPA: Uma2 family endonuclease [Phycisphaerae bacterium]|nr:Uma2 family endonuclease [Phycisphaerae bacterium]